MRKWVGLLLIFALFFSSSMPVVQADDETTIVYEQEPNDDFSTATEIMLEDEVTGSLTTEDSDLYKITIPERGTFSLWGYSHEETKGASVDFYSEDGENIFGCYELEQGMEFYCDQTVKPGTYYIQISPYENSTFNGEDYSFFTFLTPPTVYRIAGSDRYETAVNIAYEHLGENSEDIVLATGGDFPDALAAGPLAFDLGAPILLTRKNQLPDSVRTFILDVGVKRVTIIGGTSVISQQVEDYLKNTLGLTVTRIAGKDRFETAANIAKAIPGGVTDAVIVNGRNYPDALSIAPYAALGGIPILLTDTNTLPPATAQILRGKLHTMVIGGTNVISDSIFKKLPGARRIAGTDRYETSLLVSQLMAKDYVFIASGTNFPDALAGSVLAGAYGKPILLTRPTVLSDELIGLLIDQEVLTISILGGPGAVSEQVEQDLLDIISSIE
jgi:putative cell wall-binding protein